MPIVTHSEFTLGDTLVRYQAPADAPDAIGLVLIPVAAQAAVLAPREHLSAPSVTSLPAHWLPIRAWEVDPLVHVHVRGQPYPPAFASGRTLRAGSATQALKLTHQHVERTAGGTIIRTTLVAAYGLECIHELQLRADETAFRVRTTARNTSSAPLTLELLTSFSLGGLTPFATDDAPGRLRVHRLRSTWSAEGRHEERSLEDLHLERSWIGYGITCERFGQTGSMPVNGWFPLVAVEDRVAGVTWGVQLATPGSWQLELYRRNDQLALSGGQADRELGHWWKTLAPGESFTAPESFVTVCTGGFDAVCTRLKTPLLEPLAAQAASEADLPIIFNEWCTSWGSPTHANLIALADRLRGSGVTYLVIDDGWAERPGKGIQQNGDWIINRTAFPDGLRATADAIRARDLVPGIWFEFEVVNPGSRAWDETAHQLHRDGLPLQIGTRRFWDFRDPWVHDYLYQRVIRLLKDNHLGYLKVDYNDTIGLGHDGAESPGEALRQHLAGVQAFFRRLRTEIPELVIENCSSGGHREEPSMMALTAMSSFSDAHESPDIPLIAANLHRVMHPRQNQIWAVLRKEDTRQRLAFSLAATFLGRMCLSGDVHTLSPEAWDFTRQAIALYRDLAPVLAAPSADQPRRIADLGASWQHPQGHQAVLFHDSASARAFVVWHAFAAPGAAFTIPLPAGRAWRITGEFCDITGSASITADGLRLTAPRDFSGGVVVLGS
ncbi:MAG: alpha-galactosidase [Burkholderiales bacterium]|nr:alpha-galactosidase [Opitutaceae bacterium]